MFKCSDARPYQHVRPDEELVDPIGELGGVDEQLTRPPGGSGGVLHQHRPDVGHGQLVERGVQGDKRVGH